MKFKEISLRNFFSYGDSPEKLDLSQPGLYLVLGKNGQGKSSILDGICFALFGKVTKNVNLPNIVNEQIGKNCCTSLSFEINGINYFIDRYRKHDKYHDNVKVYIHDKKEENLISKSNKTDTQELINNLINFTYKSFISAVMMSQESVSSFLEADPNKKKEIIENILQLEIMTKYHWIAQQKRKKLKHEIEILDIEYKTLESNKENIKQSMIDYVNSCKDLKKEAKNKIIKLEEKLNKINEVNIEEEKNKILKVKKLEQKLETKQIDYRRALDDINPLRNELDSYETAMLEFNGFIKTNNNSKKNLNKSRKNLEKNREELNKDIKDTEHNPDKCPVCNNNINEDKLHKWLNNKNQELKDINERIKEIDESFIEIGIKDEEYNNRKKELKKQIKNVEKRIKEKEEYAKTLEMEYKEIIIPESMNEDELNKLHESKVKIEIQLKELKNKVFVDENYLHGLKNKGIELSNEIKEKNEEKIKKKKDFIITEWWESSLSSKKKSMKSWCINNVVGYFNARIKYYMDRFFDGAVQIQMDTELNESIVRNKQERTFGMFSGGEKRRLNLAILFALYSLVKANISSKINIMFLDEILSNQLDDKGISTVLELLEEMKDNKETVFIIEHRETFKDYPSFTPIFVKKDKNEFSKIKVG
jgi:exonuclease SbcC